MAHGAAGFRTLGHFLQPYRGRMAADFLLTDTRNDAVGPRRHG
jgi:hypothetical protein